MAFDDMSNAAVEASKKAKSSKDALDHKTAAILNEKAAKAAFSQGDAKTSKMHARIAKKHRRVLDKHHESTSQSDSNSTDSQDNPLLAWTNARSPNADGHG